MSDTNHEQTPGWGLPGASKKWHYFHAGRSLCLRWMYFGDTQPGNDGSPDNCAECRKRKAKHEAPAKE